MRYHSRPIKVTVHKAQHEGVLFNEMAGWLSNKTQPFNEGDLIITFDDGATFVLHPEFGRRLFERESADDQAL